MAISDYDYDKVDQGLWMLIITANNFENQIVASKLPGAEIINAISKFKEAVYLEIERQGARA